MRMKTKTLLAAALLVGLFALKLIWQADQASVNSPANSVANSPVDVAPMARSNVLSSSEDASASALTTFQEWLERFKVAAVQGGAPANLVAEGQRFAQARHDVMLRLMRENPRRALEKSVKWNEWVALPPEIRALVEEPFSETADLSVIPDCRAMDARQTPWQTHRVAMRGEFFDAFVYGRREHGQSKLAIPLQGIRLDKQVALWAEPVQPLSDDDLRAAQQIFRDGNERTRSWVSGERLNDSGKAALVGGKIHYFANAEEIQQVASAIAEAEVQPGPHNVVEAMAATLNGAVFNTKVFATAAKTAQSAWTETPKRVLAMIVNFTPASVNNYTSNILASELLITSNNIRQMSYGKTWLSNTVVPQVISITNAQSYWETNDSGVNGMMDAAKAVAAGRGYVLSNYDIFVLAMPFMQRKAGALAFAEVGGQNLWINDGPTGSGNITHEVGHIYGYGHANYWRGGTGAGFLGTGGGLEHQEYGDVFDRMGNGPGDNVPNTDHFSMRAKSYFNWIETNEVINVSTSGVYRLSRFDHINARLLSGTKLAAQVRNAAGDEFWIGYRRALTNAGYESLTNSAYVIWANDYNVHRLIDTTPLSQPNHAERQDRLDAALPVGRTYVDPSGTLLITTRGTGGTSPYEYIDVEVVLIPNAPQFSLFTTSARTTNGLMGSYVNGSLRSRTAQEDWRLTNAVTISGTRVDPSIHFTDNGWGVRASLGITNGSDADWDDFSVQWDGWIQVNRPMRIATRSDDSSRMWIDVNGDGSFGTNAPEFIDNHWGNGQGVTLGNVSVGLAPGLYRIRIQYEEGNGDNYCELVTGAAQFDLFTTSTLATNGLTGSYVNTNLQSYSPQDDWHISQTISGTRRDAYPLFVDNSQWGARASVGVTGGSGDGDWDNFSVQWDGWIRIHTPTRFATLSDDSSRMWIDVNGNGTFGSTAPEYINNHWGSGQADTYGDSSDFIAPGVYRIRMQYQEGSGGNHFALFGASEPAAPAAPYPSLVATLAPLAYWRLNENYGTTALDSVGVHHGTYINAMSLGQPGYGSSSGTGTDPTSLAAQFGPTNGAQSYVSIPTIDVSIPSGGNGQFSVAAWVKASPSNTAGAGIFAKGGGAGDEEFALDCGGPGNAFRFFVRSAQFAAAFGANSTVTPDNQWHLLVGVCDQANAQVILFVDGTNAAQTAIQPGFGIHASSIPASIGARKSGSGTSYDYQFIGLIDDAAIFTYPLPPAQVLALYAAANKPPTITQQPSATWSGVAGRSVTNMVTATGLGLSYQWYGPSGAVPGATSSSLVLTNISFSQEGNYYVIVSNIAGAVQSSNSFLTVTAVNGGFAQAVLALNPLAYWPLDETDGTTAFDYAGNNNGTYTNVILGQPGYDYDAASPTGPTSLSAQFGMANSHISIPTIDLSVPNGGNRQFSVAAWVLGSNSGPNFAFIIGKGSGGPSASPQFALDSGGFGSGFRFTVSTADERIATPTVRSYQTTTGIFWWVFAIRRIQTSPFTSMEPAGTKTTCYVDRTLPAARFPP